MSKVKNAILKAKIKKNIGNTIISPFKHTNTILLSLIALRLYGVDIIKLIKGLI
jgi:hypothetical protein